MVISSRFDRKEVIIRPGDDFNALYFILRGVAYVSLDKENQYCFRKHHAGSYFGDFCIMNLTSNVFIVNSKKRILFLLKITKKDFEEVTMCYPSDRQIILDRMAIRKNFMNNLTKEFQVLELKQNVVENLLFKGTTNFGPILKTPTSKRKLKELRSGFNDEEEDERESNVMDLGKHDYLKIEYRREKRRQKTRSNIPLAKIKKSERVALMTRKTKTERRDHDEMISVYIKGPEEDGNYFFLMNPDEKMLGVVPSKEKMGFDRKDDDLADEQKEDPHEALHKSMNIPEFSGDIEHEFFEDNENMIQMLAEKLNSSKVLFLQMMNTTLFDLQVLQNYCKSHIIPRQNNRKSFKEK